MSFLDTAPRSLAEHQPVRTAVRAFLGECVGARDGRGWVGSWEGYDCGFSRALGARGWVGMAIPVRYGGSERPLLERYVVLEELLAAGAPVGAHWIADRQIAPLLLRFGTEAQKTRFLPAIAAGESCFAIGMSEPDSGSDLAAIRTRAIADGDGWRITGAKVWSTHAHRADHMVALVRTGTVDDDRHAGLTQVLLDLDSAGISVNPIVNLAGEHHFNEVVFDDVRIGPERVVGDLGGGWGQVMSELAFERSAPDRFLSTFRLLVELVRLLESDPAADRVALGLAIGRLWGIRQMSVQVAGLLADGASPATEASLVKDLGTSFEQAVPELARRLADHLPPDARPELFEALLEYDILHTPSFSIRGGTREVIRGIIARGLGLR